MPIIKSAKKALRQTKKRTVANKDKKGQLKSAVKTLSRGKTPELLNAVFALADKAAKIGAIHKNKAARLKSRAAKSMSTPVETKTATKKRKNKTR